MPRQAGEQNPANGAAAAGERPDRDRFLGLVAHGSDDGRRWSQPITPELTGGRGDLFGGCAVGAAIAGLERCTGRPLVWITAQFLAPSRPPGHLRFEIDRLVEGRNLTQATAVARIDGSDHLTFQAALGARPSLPDHAHWSPAPTVVAPEDCEPIPPVAGTGGLRPRFECRAATAAPSFPTASPRPAGGASLFWFRTDGYDLGDPALLAIVLDFVPMALTAALDRPVFGASLDNTVRVVERASTDWVLTRFSLDSVARGIGQVNATIWARDGTPLVTGSQTCVITDRPPPSP